MEPEEPETPNTVILSGLKEEILEDFAELLKGETNPRVLFAIMTVAKVLRRRDLPEAGTNRKGEK
jgi:hypothetical protein